MVNKFQIPDIYIEDEKLFYRHKITYFEISDIDAICIYIKKDEGFFVSHYVDYLEIENNQQLTAIKSVLTKEFILIEDMAQLIFLFGNYSDKLTKDDLIQISNEIFDGMNLDQMFFSV